MPPSLLSWKRTEAGPQPLGSSLHCAALGRNVLRTLRVGLPALLKLVSREDIVEILKVPFFFIPFFCACFHSLYLSLSLVLVRFVSVTDSISLRVLSYPVVGGCVIKSNTFSFPIRSLRVFRCRSSYATCFTECATNSHPCR